jgi:hypothetical protein
MKLRRKTNYGHMLLGVAILASTAANALVLAPKEPVSWAIPGMLLAFLLFMVRRQRKPIAYLHGGKLILDGEEIDDERLEYWRYNVVSEQEHEIVLKYPGFNEHHIVLMEHEESLEDQRLYDFISDCLATPESTDSISD